MNHASDHTVRARWPEPPSPSATAAKDQIHRRGAEPPMPLPSSRRTSSPRQCRRAQQGQRASRQDGWRAVGRRSSDGGLGPLSGPTGAASPAPIWVPTMPTRSPSRPLTRKVVRDTVHSRTTGRPTMVVTIAPVPTGAVTRAPAIGRPHLRVVATGRQRARRGRCRRRHPRRIGPHDCPAALCRWCSPWRRSTLPRNRNCQNRGWGDGSPPLGFFEQTPDTSVLSPGQGARPCLPRGAGSHPASGIRQPVPHREEWRRRFTAHDEAVAIALARSAGATDENARLQERVSQLAVLEV